jgi:hypothetical protein
MYCPECGNDAGSAKFCPECGADLAGVQDALSGKTGAAKAAKSGGGGATTTTATATTGGPKRISPAVIWGGFGALAVVVIVIVVMVSGGFGGGGSSDDTAANASGAPAQAVSADTSGSYGELVARANDLYDQGDSAFQNQDFEQGGAYFAAAAKVYAAAWKKQATEPTVGTDYAVALFYSGDIPGATAQIDAVLKANPDFQKAWLNKGIFLSHEGRISEQGGDKKAAQNLFAEAKTAFTRAVAIDPKSEAGQQADQSLQQLQQ